MIHRNDERAFRFIELTCYISLLFALGFLKMSRRGAAPYAFPVMLTSISLVGLVFMARFFIYQNPEQVWNRTRAEHIEISTATKRALAFGFTMCVPMFALGCIGLFSPSTMNRAISAISPMRFLLQ